jgi:hypothetical protein
MMGASARSMSQWTAAGSNLCGWPPRLRSAHWIETGSDYEFRLYDSDHTELLAKLVVTKAIQQ